MSLEDTELTLGLPGGGARRERAAPMSPAAAVSGGFGSCSTKSLSTNNKRGFEETGDVDLELDLLSSNGEATGGGTGVDDKLEAEATSHMVGEAPAAKARMIGWPPVRSFRKKVLAPESCKYVKAAADGAPYLRKIDLEMYDGYKELLKALQEMFTCFNIRGLKCDEGKLVKPGKGIEYVPTYEDRDGDWMLVGDVPWKMFTESCKRMRLMKSSEAVGLGPRTTSDAHETRI
ncbi:hypothetical protein TIFTF001_019621 [Ficus carica]|uniref:Auxin-responsive protein n=1 Tax=Ficus carica TaxID=3494 RepID=A0AA88AQP8_FICCA|nr:hypothetical protein TIFTF001_019621 [Ficus carica]